VLQIYLLHSHYKIASIRDHIETTLLHISFITWQAGLLRH